MAATPPVKQMQRKTVEGPRTTMKRTPFHLPLLALLLSLLFAHANSTTAQRALDRSRTLGLAIGTGYYLGELNPTGHFKGTLHTARGAFMRFNYNRRLGVKVGVLGTTIEAHDADSDDAWRQNRNLHFRNRIIEGSAVVEFNYKDYQLGDTYDAFSPYLFAGLSVYSHMPTAMVGEQWLELQPLGTEGQGTTGGAQRYATTGLAIPFGLGFKWNIARFTAVNFEWGMRRTFTDYLDDVSGYYPSSAVLEDELGDLAERLSDQRVFVDGSVADPIGQQRGEGSFADRFGVLSISIIFRVDRKPNNCWKG
jgi:hypothetical protein